MIKTFTVYKNVTSDIDQTELKENAERIFRTIADIPNQIDWNSTLKNCKVDKVKLKKYFNLRYS